MFLAQMWPTKYRACFHYKLDQFWEIGENFTNFLTIPFQFYILHENFHKNSPICISVILHEILYWSKNRSMIKDRLYPPGSVYHVMSSMDLFQASEDPEQQTDITVTEGTNASINAHIEVKNSLPMRNFRENSDRTGARTFGGKLRIPSYPLVHHPPSPPPKILRWRHHLLPSYPPGHLPPRPLPPQPTSRKLRKLQKSWRRRNRVGLCRHFLVRRNLRIKELKRKSWKKKRKKQRWNFVSTVVLKFSKKFHADKW